MARLGVRQSIPKTFARVIVSPSGGRRVLLTAATYAFTPLENSYPMPGRGTLVFGLARALRSREQYPESARKTHLGKVCRRLSGLGIDRARTFDILARSLAAAVCKSHLEVKVTLSHT